MDKERRQQRLLRLIRVKPLGTQGELAAHLARAGFMATQSSVSRDLEELGIVKQRGRYVVPQPMNGKSARGLLSLDVAGDALVVAKCEPGLASAVAVEIDGAAISEIVARSRARTRSSSPSRSARRSARRSKKSGRYLVERRSG